MASRSGKDIREHYLLVLARQKKTNQLGDTYSVDLRMRTLLVLTCCENSRILFMSFQICTVFLMWLRGVE